MGREKPKKRRKDERESSTDDSDFDDAPEKYETYKVSNYIRKYPETSQRQDFVVFLNHKKPNTAFSDSDKVCLSQALRKYAVSGVLHLRPVNKYKVAITFDVSNNANTFLANQKFLDELGLLASIPAADTEATGVVKQVPIGMASEVANMGGEEAGRDAARGALTATQRARMERQRQRARALHEARLAGRHAPAATASGGAARDSGGGFLLEDEPPAPRAPAHPPAPLPHRSQQPACLECGRPVPASYLLDTFDYSVCDECRDDEDAHSLLTRTEAKSEYLLKDCDLDARPPPLRCVRRRNPHRAHYSDMRLYLRAQVAERALQVWGSEAALEAEREARARRRDRALETGTRRRLRELRLAARSSLLRGARAAPHAHAWGPETPLGGDAYERVCTGCGHAETYEKM